MFFPLPSQITMRMNEIEHLVIRISRYANKSHNSHIPKGFEAHQARSISLPFLRPRMILYVARMRSLFPTDNLRTETSPLSLSLYQKFMYALNSKESKR